MVQDVMGLKSFDRKFGKGFHETLPSSPGVYRFLDADGQLVYVGKAKNLKKRLGQYRNARRIKAHRKMQKIVRASHHLEIEPCATELDALLLENKLIQDHRPPLNVAGAFSFLYPAVGLQRTRRHLQIAYSTDPEALNTLGFQRFGCYRSRDVVKSGYQGLTQVLAWLGHKERISKRVPFTLLDQFRQIPRHLDDLLARFFTGQSDELLKHLVLDLLNKPAARRDAAEVQVCIDDLKTFYQFECTPLKQLLDQEGAASFVEQRKRDPLSLVVKHTNRGDR